MDLKTAIRITAEAEGYLKGLEQVRTESLKTYSQMKSGLTGAQQAWKDAEAQVKAMAGSLDMSTATAKQRREFEGLIKTAGQLKDAYLATQQAVAQARSGLQSNSAQIDSARSAVTRAQQAKAEAAAVEAAQQRAAAAAVAAKRAEAAEQQRLAQIVVTTRTRMAMAAQEQLVAEKAAYAEAQAASARYATAQKAQADQAAARAKADAAYRAAVLASQDSRDRFARQAVQPQVATQPVRLAAPQGAQLSAISQQLALARNAALTLIGAQGIAELVRIVDGYTQLAARLKLVTSSTYQAAAAQRELFALSQRNGVAMADSAALFLRVARPMRELGQSQAQILGVTEGVAQAIRLSGSTAQESSAAMLQFAQALGAGTLAGDELKSILENAPRLAQAVADGLGVSTDKLKDMGSQGALSSEKVLRAMQSQLPQLRKEAESIPLTIGQSITQVQNAFAQYVGSADASIGSSRRMAEALSWVAANFGKVAEWAVTASAAVAAGWAASRIAGFVTAAGGVIAALASWPVVAAVAAAAGTSLWLGMGSGVTGAKDKVSSGLASMSKELVDFGGKMDETARNDAIGQLVQKVEEAQARLKSLSVEDAVGSPGKKLKAEIADAQRAIDDTRKIQGDQARKNLTAEKSTLGLDKLKVDGTALIEKATADQLQAFDKLYAAFAGRAINSSGALATSFQEVRTSINGLISAAKTPADFEGLVRRLQTASKNIAVKQDPTVQNQLVAAIEARAAAEKTALDTTLSGVSTRLQRANAYVQSIAEQARVAATFATALDRVSAEIRADVPALSADQSATIRAQVAAVQAGADQQLAALSKLSSEKIAILNRERVAAARVATDARIDADTQASTRRRLLDVEKAALETKPAASRTGADTQRLADIAQEERKIAKDLADEKKRIRDAEVGDAASAARRIADVERQTAQDRLQILRSVQQELASKANEALQNYKTYAQQVKELDRSIVQNRLDTASSVNALLRKDMTPTQQAGSVRAELDQVRAETERARQAGDQQAQLQLLSRQKSLANDLAGVQGDGVDPKQMRAEAIDNLKRIGDESDSVLRSQREQAQAAAEQQKATFEQLAQAAQRISAEIAKINAGEAIKLQAEVDMTSVKSAIEQVRAAFANETFAIKIAAQTQASGYKGELPQGAADMVARATGGPIAGPGGPTSDAIPALLSNGEHVLTAAEVQAAGGHAGIYAIRAALRGGWMPRFAEGGAVGSGSILPGLSVPTIESRAAEQAMQPMHLTMPGSQTFAVQAKADEARAMERWVRLENLKYGRLTK